MSYVSRFPESLIAIAFSIFITRANMEIQVLCIHVVLTREYTGFY